MLFEEGRELVESLKSDGPIFVIAFDFERLRIYQDIFFDGEMRAIIFEFPRSVGELCGRGKDIHNEAWRLDRLHSSPVAWIARHRYVGIEVACVRIVFFELKVFFLTDRMAVRQITWMVLEPGSREAGHCAGVVIA